MIKHGWAHRLHCALRQRETRPAGRRVLVPSRILGLSLSEGETRGSRPKRRISGSNHGMRQLSARSRSPVPGECSPELEVTLAGLCLHTLPYAPRQVAERTWRERYVIVDNEPPRCLLIGLQDTVPPTSTAGVIRNPQNAHPWPLESQSFNGTRDLRVDAVVHNYERLHWEVNGADAAEQVAGVEDGGNAKHRDRSHLIWARRGCDEGRCRLQGCAHLIYFLFWDDPGIEEER